MSLFNDAFDEFSDLLSRLSGKVTTSGFAKGDNVTSQGQDMTIVRVGAQRLRCEWNNGGQVQQKWFGPAQLRKGSHLTQESPDARKWRDIQEGRF